MDGGARDSNLRTFWIILRHGAISHEGDGDDSFVRHE